MQGQLKNTSAMLCYTGDNGKVQLVFLDQELARTVVQLVSDADGEFEAMQFDNMGALGATLRAFHAETGK